MKKTFKILTASILLFGSVVMASAEPFVTLDDPKTFHSSKVINGLNVHIRVN